MDQNVQLAGGAIWTGGAAGYSGALLRGLLRACTSASVEPSYVLRAMGKSDAEAGASLRMGLGRFTTEAEIDIAGTRIIAEVTRLRGGKAAAE